MTCGLYGLAGIQLAYPLKVNSDAHATRSTDGVMRRSLLIDLDKEYILICIAERMVD